MTSFLGLNGRIDDFPSVPSRKCKNDQFFHLLLYRSDGHPQSDLSIRRCDWRSVLFHVRP